MRLYPALFDLAGSKTGPRSTTSPCITANPPLNQVTAAILKSRPIPFKSTPPCSLVIRVNFDYSNKTSALLITVSSITLPPLKCWRWTSFMSCTCVKSVNPLKTKRRPSPYCAVNTFYLGYRNQSVYAVSGTRRCLFSDKYKTLINIGQCVQLLNVKLVVHHVTSRLYLKIQSVPRCKHFSSRL